MKTTLPVNIVKSFYNDERVKDIKKSLTNAYMFNDKDAIREAAKKAQVYVDSGGDFLGHYDDNIEDYEGFEPDKLAEKYITRLLHDRFCDDDNDQYYIENGFSKEEGEKEFHLNENGVCMNPNVVTYRSGHFRAMLETAKIDGKWYCGFWLESSKSGNLRGVSKASTPYQNEKEAMKAAAQYAVDYFNRIKDEKVPDFIFKELNSLLKPQYVQLSLFDF